jgi:hypothetical protein
LTLDPAKFRAMAGRAVGSRSETTTDAVSAWKRTRSQMAQHSTGAASTTAQKRRQHGAEETDSTRRFEAGEGEPAAFDVAGEAGAGPRRADSPIPQRRDQHTPGPADEDDGDYTSRLLRAKRRAKGDDSDDDAGDAGGGAR